MPTFFIIDGVKIEFFYNDHLPPHYHASIAEYEALISIKSHKIIKGSLPKKKKKKILNWSKENEKILMEIWESMKKEVNRKKEIKMKSKQSRMPRIIKINDVVGFKVYCAFNNGEHRVIDFKKLFSKWKVKEGGFEYEITKPEVFKTVQLESNTLSWPQITKKIKLSNGMEFDAPYEVDPIVLYENSELDEKRNKRYRIGKMIRQARKEAGLTQEELAKKSGTSKTYISRIENDKSDIELGTLRKIIEIGLNKRLEIVIDE